MLQECVGNHRHQGMPMQALPGASLEVIEAQFLLHLLMRLFANPAGFDDRRQFEQFRFGRQVGEIVFRLAAGAALTDQPDLFSGKMLLPLVADPLWRPIGDTHTNGGKTCLQCAFGSLPPTDGSPSGRSQHLFGWL